LKGKNPSEANIQKARLLRIPIVDEDFLEKCICRQAIAFPWFLLEPSKQDSKEFSATEEDIEQAKEWISKANKLKKYNVMEEALELEAPKIAKEDQDFKKLD